MIRAHLGEAIDIHGGGRDLIFPHHENERAQSCCAYGGDFVRHWVHNAYVDMDGEKMSKSLGNVRTVRELRERYPGEVLRFALLSAHYRSPLNFSGEFLTVRRHIGYVLRRLEAPCRCATSPICAVEQTAVFAALLDDLNTPEAMAALHGPRRRSIKQRIPDEVARAKAELLLEEACLACCKRTPKRGLRSDAIWEPRVCRRSD